MIRIIDGNKATESEILSRDIRLETGVEEIVTDILAHVREEGDAALLRYAEEFDKARLTQLRVSEAEIDEAVRHFEKEEPAFLSALAHARDNIRAFHEKQVRTNFVITGESGTVMGQKITPIERVGLYIPGGTASYPSSVLMNAVPAKIAGVKKIVMVTPPGRDGKIASMVLAAARLAGVDEIYKVGGAQAVAALAYGTQTIPKVDKIVGPGNVFVATAKRKLYGLVDIDMIAGPSEILVIADGSCNPAFVAADLLSQAEHDKLAGAVLVTDSESLAKAVAEEIEVQLPQLPRCEIARASIEANGKIILTDSIEDAVAISNRIAPEHLEICTDDPMRYLGMVTNAGSIFLGKYAPEPLGDYYAGPNHTLPTSGTARFSSPLSVDDFIKKSSFVCYTKEALAGAMQDIVCLAEHEGLHAHAESVRKRIVE